MNVVVAVYEDWGIGRGGSQPVVIPEDRRHFRSVTHGGTVIVGRRTLMEFPGGNPLKNRRNIILTRDRNFSVTGGETAGSISAVLELVKDEEPDSVFVIGGESVYRQFLPYCHRAFVTKIKLRPESDAFFPNLDELTNWEPEEESGTLLYGEIEYSFVTYINRDLN